jgi:hypothetical protein
MEKELIVKLLGALLECDSPKTSSTSNRGRFKKGTRYLFRTVTHYHIGRVVDSDDQFVWLDDAFWIADTGRLSECLETGKVSEFERISDECATMVNIQALCDAFVWPHGTPVAK